MKKILIVILISAFLIRLTSLFFGLPYINAFGDEIVHTIVAFKILASQNPIVPFGESYLPPLLSYLLVPIFALVGGLGILLGYFHGLADFKDFVILYREWFLVWGRLLAAIFGTATVYVLYLLAKKIFDEKVALLAAFLLAFDFLHVHDSQIGHVWVPLTFFIIAAFYCLYNLYLNGERKWYWLSALSIGLGYGVGQYPAIIFLWFLVTHYLLIKKKKQRFWNKLFIGSAVLCLILILIFTLGNFYSFYKHFYEAIEIVFKFFGFRGLLPPISTVSSKTTGLGGNLLTYVQTLFFNNPILLIFGFLGALAAWKKRSGFERFVLFGFPFLSAAYFIFTTFIIYRYIFPVIPFLIIFASYFVFWLVEKQDFVKNKKAMAVFLVAAVSVYSLTASLLYSVKLLRPLTISQAISWTYQNIPAGSRIVSDVYLNSNKESIKLLAQYNSYNWVDLRRQLLSTLDEKKYPQPSYFLIDDNLTNIGLLSDQARYADYGLIFFYDEKGQEERLAVLDAVGGEHQLIASFYPQRPMVDIGNILSLEPHFFLKTLWPADYIGPYVEIYKITNQSQ